MVTVGTHCILELYDCPLGLLNDMPFVRQALIKATERCLSTLLQQATHQFHPHGVTAVGLLAESHISIHTWPECRYVAADLFTCGNRAKPKQACMYLVQTFEAKDYDLVELPRGPATPRMSLVDRLANLTHKSVAEASEAVQSHTPHPAAKTGSIRSQMV